MHSTSTIYEVQSDADYIVRVATNLEDLENMEKSEDLKVVRETVFCRWCATVSSAIDARYSYLDVTSSIWESHGNVREYDANLTVFTLYCIYCGP